MKRDKIPTTNWVAERVRERIPRENRLLILIHRERRPAVCKGPCTRIAAQMKTVRKRQTAFFVVFRDLGRGTDYV